MNLALLTRPFNVRHLNGLHLPEAIQDVKQLIPAQIPSVNSLLIKRPGRAQFEIVHPQLTKLLEVIQNEVRRRSLPHVNRYVYLTIDNRPYDPVTRTQRRPGWHVDGLQGREVAEKVEPDFTFLCANHHATVFCNDTVMLPPELDVHKHDVFHALEKACSGLAIKNTDENWLYLFDAYTAHRAYEPLPVETARARTFIRVSYTLTPITNRHMTINPFLTYDYPYHTTDGKAPEDLIKL